jgi:hypothetical protein
MSADGRPDVSEVMALAAEARLEDYSAGMARGMEIALRLVLGEEPVEGTEPMPGDLEPDQERWARDALARLTEGTAS